MTINLSAPEMTELKPRIVVIGVGGAGGNAVNNMIESGLQGVDFVVANTDSQALALNKAERKIQLGTAVTQGLGCGARPEVGRQAALESIDEVLDHMSGTHMAFITAGMGGGTGTGAGPAIAEALREKGILTVGVVTKPFQFEGSRRMRLAESGIEEMQEYVDTLIIIPNQNLFRLANEKTTFADAFSMADNVLHSGVRGITDLMMVPGLINLDFADVRTVMSEMGKAMMGTGEAEGDTRAIDAAEAAISNPLLDEVSMKGAQGLLVNISGGMDLTLYEVDEAANRIREEVDPEANIIVGSALDERLNGVMRVSVVATGIDAEAMARAGQHRSKLTSLSGVRRRDEKSSAPDAAEQIPAAAASAADTTGPDSDSEPQVAGIASRDNEILYEGDKISKIMERLRDARSDVPAAKPLQPEQGVMSLAGERLEDIVEEPFIAPQATTPAEEKTVPGEALEIPAEPQPQEPVSQPAPAMAAVTPPAPVMDNEPAPAPRRRGLLSLMTRSGREAARADVAEGNSLTRQPADAPQLDIPEPSAPQSEGTSGDEDMLAIPTFLRRQAR